MEHTIYLEYNEEHKIIKNIINNKLKIIDLFLIYYELEYDNKFNNEKNKSDYYFTKDNVLINSNDRIIDIINYNSENNENNENINNSHNSHNSNIIIHIKCYNFQMSPDM
jgi:hypothetical protein